MDALGLRARSRIRPRDPAVQSIGISIPRTDPRHERLPELWPDSFEPHSSRVHFELDRPGARCPKTKARSPLLHERAKLHRWVLGRVLKFAPTAAADPFATPGDIVTALLDVLQVRLRGSLLWRPARFGLVSLATVRI